MCESIVVVGAALSADVDAPTERVHSAPGARRGQSLLRMLEAVQSLTMASSPRNLSEPPPHLWVIPHFFTPVVLLL